MTNPRNRKRGPKPRIALTPEDNARLHAIRGDITVPDLARRTRLPYMLVYNIWHGRIRSLSDAHYRVLFGEAPPARKISKVDGTIFRAMVDLWLYLDAQTTLKDLARALYGAHGPRSPDFRIFTGQTRTVDFRLEQMMRAKFAAAGIDDALLARWIEEFRSLPPDDRVPYNRIRPLLRYLQDELGLHPTAVLHQAIRRYETGQLKSVSRRIYDKARDLKRKTEEAVAHGNATDRARLRESLTGGKEGYTLFLDVADELRFLRRHARQSAKRFLGRSAWTYAQGKAKRIADWRAQRIREACDRFVQASPQLKLAVLPRSQQRKRIRRLLDVLVRRAAQLLSQSEGIPFEKRILRPAHHHDEYAKGNHGFTRFEQAFSVLGMHKKAFDLLVAKNCEIFRLVGKYTQRWYLSDLYLRELAQNAHFDLISAKYELLAQSAGLVNPAETCRLN